MFVLILLIYLLISCVFVFSVFSENFRAKPQIRFLSRRCFSLCIRMEVEPRTAKLYNSCFCKNYRGKVGGGWKKGSASFFT